MKLIECYIENFGNLHNYTYEFKDGLNTIKEDNGFGKTTFATFIKSMFYGFDNSKAENADRKKYKPWQGGNFGGNIEFEIQNKKYRIERFFGKNTSEDSFKLYDLSTNLESDDYTENIGEEIFKINRDGYERSVYIPQGQIQIKMEDSLNAKLGNVLESDNDMNTSDDAIKAITETMKTYKKIGNKGIINEKKNELNELERKLENSKSDLTNMEIREKNLDETIKQIKEKTEKKEQKQKILANKIEQGRKSAKKETYNNILSKLSETETKYNKLQLFFKSSVPDDNKLNELNNKIIEIEKYKVELENTKLSEEDEKEISELEAKFENTNFTEHEIEKELKKIENKSKKNTKKFNILLIIGALAVIFGIALLGFSISRIIGVFAIILGVITVIFSATQMKSEDNTEKIIELTNLKTQFIKYEDLKNKKQVKELAKKEISTKINETENEINSFLLKYFENMNLPVADLIQEIKLKKNELKYVTIELENCRKQKEDYEKINNVEELSQENSLEDVNENELTEEIRNLEIEIDKLNDEKNQNKNQIEILQNKIDENEYLENDIELLKEEIEEKEQKYNILEKTKNLLLEAKQTFSSSYLQEMFDGFEHYLGLINSEEIDTNVDINLDVKIDVNGKKKDVKHFSAGYQDLIYICMRFSLIKALYKDEIPFVLLDDPFVNLDDERTKKAIKLVGEFAKEYQVIYFVCNTSRI